VTRLGDGNKGALCLGTLFFTRTYGSYEPCLLHPYGDRNLLLSILGREREAGS